MCMKELSLWENLRTEYKCLWRGVGGGSILKVLLAAKFLLSFV